MKRVVYIITVYVQFYKFYKFTSLLLLSAHIAMWYKEYYKLTQIDQAVEFCFQDDSITT